MTQPLVSVQMVTYNHVLYISKAIEGVLSQKTNASFELIIGEDCSTDGTREIVFDYAQRYPEIIRVITSDDNVGMVRNCYRVAMACRGKYAAFCEGDDFWHNANKLHKQLEYMENHPKCGLICSDYDVYFVDRKKRQKRFNYVNNRNPEQLKDIVYTLRGVSGIQTCTVLVRQDIYRKVLETNSLFYQDSTQPCLDRPLWMAIMTESDIGYINESLATYNILDYSATRDKDPARLLRISIRMKEQIIYLIEHYNLPNEERCIHVNDLWRRKLKLSFFENDAALAIECKAGLRTLSLIELIQFWGACHLRLKWFFIPLVKYVYSGIPTSKY